MSMQHRTGLTWLRVLVLDVAAPAVLTGVTTHELLYDHAGAITWLLAVLTVWPLLLRRRFPAAVLLVCLLAGLTLWARHTFTLADLSVLVGLYSVAAHRGLRVSLPATAAVEAGAIALSFRFAPTGSVNDAVLLISGLVAAAVLAGTTMRAQRRYLATVEDRAARLELERAQQAELAAAAERTRIAREMHDIVAHGLSVVIALAEGAALTSPNDPAAAKDAMHQVAATGRQSLTEMRRLLGVLRTDGPAEHGPQPTLAAVHSLVAEVRRTGLAVDLDVAGEQDAVPDGLQTTVFRIVQESLTNVLKHAHSPTRVVVDLAIEPERVRFSVLDDGRWQRSPVPARGNGVTGMHERVGIYGGVLDAGPTAVGWQVRGELPTA